MIQMTIHRTCLAAAVLALGCNGATQAQEASSVQLYGQIGQAVSYKTHQTGGLALKEVSDNVLAASLWGVRGTEDLGGGMKAQFRIESGIGADTGSAGATVAGVAKFWNRLSYVGLDIGPVATVTVGRQFHAATDRVIQSLDVYNLAPSTPHAAPLALIGVNRFVGNDSRADNSVKLRLRGPAGLTAAASVAAGEGSTSRSYSADVAQVTSNYSVGAFFTEYDAPTLIASTGYRPKQRVFGVGGNASMGPVRLYLSWLDNRLDATVAGRATQENRVVFGGIAWQATSAATLKLAYYDDRGSSLNGVVGRDGKKTTIVASAEYGLSKRTSLYTAFSKNSFADGYMLDPLNIAALGRDPAAASTQQVSAGIKHVF